MSKKTVIKINGIGMDVCHGVVQVDGVKKAEVTITPAPSNPFDSEREPIPVDFGELFLTGPNVFEGTWDGDDDDRREIPEGGRK